MRSEFVALFRYESECFEGWDLQNLGDLLQRLLD